MAAFKSKYFSVNLPRPWKAAALHNRVVLHDGSFRGEDNPEDLPEVATFEHIVDQAGDASLAEYAKGLMERYVAQGEPEHYRGELGSIPAEVYEWTDGVTEIVTWFVEPAQGEWFRVEYATKDPRKSWEAVRPRARELLGAVTWAVAPTMFA